MINIIRLLPSMIGYGIKARHNKGHGIHSPYVYEFVKEVFFNSAISEDLLQVEEIRKSLLRSDLTLSVIDFGEKSRGMKSKKRSIRQMVRSSSIRSRYGKVLYRICKHVNPATIFELGTSIGLSASYMAVAGKNSSLISIEGNRSLCQFSKNVFRANNLSNIELINGQFDQVLPKLLEQYAVPDMVYIDGNHNYSSTLNYYRLFVEKMVSGIIIFDDIRWSPGMWQAWKQIAADPKARVSIELFRMGIILLNPSVTPGKYIVRY